MENQIKVCISGQAMENRNITVNIETSSPTKPQVDTESSDAKMKFMEMRMKQMSKLLSTYETMVHQLQSENSHLIEFISKSHLRPVIKADDKAEVEVKKEESLNDLLAEFTGNDIFADDDTADDEEEEDDELQEAFNIFD